MDGQVDLLLARDFGLALLIGALVGLEREKHRAIEHEESIGGLRTFILFAQAGAVSMWLARQIAAPWIFAAAALGISATVIAGYLTHARARGSSIGLTTEVAAIATFLLGGVCLAGQPGLAVALGIATSAVLAWKEPLHGLVERIGLDDIYAGLKLLIASVIVLPLLPREAIDPWGALNPYRLWLLVVLISGLSLVGYVSVRWLGTGRGTVVTGLFGGLVSSTAVTLTFARRSRDDEGPRTSAAVLAAGLLVAWAVMFVRVVILVGAVHPPLLGRVIVPMSLMGIASIACATAYYLLAGRGPDRGQADVPLSNPFSLRSAMGFAAFFALVLLAVEIAKRALPPAGIYVVAALAGTTDVDAITLSMATSARGGLPADVAVVAIVLATFANTLVKTGMVAATGTAELRRRVALAALAIMIAGGAVLLLGAGGVG
jgi:uncharacterized membrane protein (DUF4010 family)